MTKYFYFDKNLQVSQLSLLYKQFYNFHIF
jgi:hypothetical protein